MSRELSRCEGCKGLDGRIPCDEILAITISGIDDIASFYEIAKLPDFVSDALFAAMSNNIRNLRLTMHERLIGAGCSLTAEEFEDNIWTQRLMQEG
jgi:hypothetical protein